MAGVRGPLFGFDASGSIANTLVWAKWKGRPYVRQLVIPSNPRTIFQRGVRAMFGFCSSYYTNLTTVEKNAWIFEATADQITGMNAWIRDSQTNRVNDRSARNLPTAGPGVAPAAPTFPIAVGGPGRYTVTWTASVDAFRFTYTAYRDPVMGFTPSPANLVAVKAARAGFEVLTFTETGLTPGTWFLRLKTGNEGGTLGTATAEFSVVVT